MSLGERELSRDYGVNVREGVPEEWARMTQGVSLFATKRWLNVMGSRIEGEQLSFLLEQGGLPQAGLYATLVSNPECYEAFNSYLLLAGDPPVFPLTIPVLQQREITRHQAPPRREWFPNLVVMLPGYQCFPVGPHAESSRAAVELVDGIVEWSRSRGLRLVSFLYTSAEAVTLRQVLASRGFHRIPLTSRCDLNLCGSNFDDYLATLTKNRRRGVHREMRLLRRSGVITAPICIDDCFEDVIRLRCKLMRKYGHETDEATEQRRLESLTRHFVRGELVVFCAKVDSVVLGYCMFLIYGQTWHAFWTGTDYDHPLSRYVYFDTAFYAAISEAIGRGVQKIDYGIGHWEAKSVRGCRVVPLDGWVYPLAKDLEKPVEEAARAMSGDCISAE